MLSSSIWPRRLCCCLQSLVHPTLYGRNSSSTAERSRSIIDRVDSNLSRVSNLKSPYSLVPFKPCKRLECLRDQALKSQHKEKHVECRIFHQHQLKVYLHLGPLQNLQIVECFLHPYGLEDCAVACSHLYIRPCMDGIPPPLLNAVGASLTELIQTCHGSSNLKSPYSLVPFKPCKRLECLRDQALKSQHKDKHVECRIFHQHQLKVYLHLGPLQNLQIVECFLHPYGLEDCAVACSHLYIRPCMDGIPPPLLNIVDSNLSGIVLLQRLVLNAPWFLPIRLLDIGSIACGDHWNLSGLL